MWNISLQCDFLYECFAEIQYELQIASDWQTSMGSSDSSNSWFRSPFIYLFQFSRCFYLWTDCIVHFFLFLSACRQFYVCIILTNSGRGAGQHVAWPYLLVRDRINLYFYVIGYFLLGGFFSVSFTFSVYESHFVRKLLTFVMIKMRYFFNFWVRVQLLFKFLFFQLICCF